MKYNTSAYTWPRGVARDVSHALIAAGEKQKKKKERIFQTLFIKSMLDNIVTYFFSWSSRKPQVWNDYKTRVRIIVIFYVVHMKQLWDAIFSETSQSVSKTKLCFKISTCITTFKTQQIVSKICNTIFKVTQLISGMD